MPTLYLAADRTPWFTDHEGYPSRYKDNDAVESVQFDWSRDLGSDTISTSTWESAGGLTLSGASSTTTTATVTVTGTDGDATNKVVTAGSKTYYRTVRFYGRET